MTGLERLREVAEKHLKSRDAMECARGKTLSDIADRIESERPADTVELADLGRFGEPVDRIFRWPYKNGVEDLRNRERCTGDLIEEIEG